MPAAMASAGERFLGALAGGEADAGGDRLARRAQRSGASADGDGPAGAGQYAGEPAPRRLVALPAQAGKADDLAGADLEAHRPEQSDAKVFHGQRRRAAASGASPRARHGRAADDLLDELVGRNIERPMHGDDGAVA